MAVQATHRQVPQYARPGSLVYSLLSMTRLLPPPPPRENLSVSIMPLMDIWVMYVLLKGVPSRSWYPTFIVKGIVN